MKVIALCSRQNIAVLPIHDGFVVKKQHCDALKDIMVKAYKLLGFVSVPMVTED